MDIINYTDSNVTAFVKLFDETFEFMKKGETKNFHESVSNLMKLVLTMDTTYEFSRGQMQNTWDIWINNPDVKFDIFLWIMALKKLAQFKKEENKRNCFRYVFFDWKYCYEPNENYDNLMIKFKNVFDDLLNFDFQIEEEQK